ncbi:GTA-gp10 family protein [Zavarzinia sp.]|uniref:GTA-gp10 family protein n=1 Tax=Zavarzinia sp. TaxID=2027920 RepID=UPI003BB5DF85
MTQVPANPVRGEVSIDLGGGLIVVLRPAYDELVAIEVETGRGMIDLARRFMDRTATLTETVAVVRAAARAAGNLPPDDLGKRLLAIGIIRVMAQVGAFIAAAISGGAEGNAPGAGSV